MGLFKKFDYWSILEGLTNIRDYEHDSKEKSVFWTYYEEEIRELSDLALDLMQEMEEIQFKIMHTFPKGFNNFYGEDRSILPSIAWWNTAACMLSDIDMEKISDSEKLFNTDYTSEKKKRIQAIEQLTMKQQVFLWSKVSGFISRYLDLMAAFETITGIIQELERFSTNGILGKA